MAGFKAGDRAIVLIENVETEVEVLGSWGTNQSYIVQVRSSGEVQNRLMGPAGALRGQPVVIKLPRRR